MIKSFIIMEKFIQQQLDLDRVDKEILTRLYY